MRRNLFRFYGAAASLVAFGWMMAAMPALANIPGGGNGTGANVTLVTNGDGTVTMANGIVTAKIEIATAQILQYTYNGFQVTDGGTAANNGFYWQGNSGSSDRLTTIVNPATNSGNFAEIQLYDNYTNSGANADAYRYFALFRGSPGVYVSEIMQHTAAMPSGGIGIPSLTCKLGADIFNWLGQDTGRNLLMPRVADFNTGLGGINYATKEVTLLTQGQMAGRFDNKYDYSGDLGALGFSGWCSTNQAINFGLWMVHPSDEYFTCGPMHREILAQMMLINSTFSGVHFGFHDDLTMSSGENWAKVAGPFFLYFNKVTAGTTNPQAALYADAMAQTAAERGAWPYAWFTDPNYVAAAGRGTVAGKMVIADSGNPNASASNLWVGVVQQPNTPTTPAPTDFQLWGKTYQYWTKSDANGNFVLSNVIAGANYTLFAFGPGAIGQFQSQPLSGAAPVVTISTPASPFSVTVNAGQTNNLGTVTWTPSRIGATVWEMGVPDRDTAEFRHGEDYWHGDIGNATNLPVNWAQWQDFSADFPNGLTYTVGQSHWAKDWDYAQGTVLDPITGNLNTDTWTVSFNLPGGPTNGAQGSIYLGVAADYSGPVIVQINGNNVAGSTGFFPAYSDTASANDAMIRMGSHGIFCDARFNFSGSLLRAGQNTVTLSMRKGGYFSNSALYDYVRLELTGYVPPAPTGLTANAGNGLVSLWWPAAPGATGYNVLRSTSPGGGYASIATNVIGPTCGAVDDTVAFTDTNVVNGMSYYYMVQSMNPGGNSTNSAPAGATPSTGTAPAPVVPANVTATGGNNQVVLNWNPSLGAARYVIHRTVLTTGGVTTYVPGGINPYRDIASYVTVTNYTDTALANNVVYSYVVSAVNANGQSTNSLPVSTLAQPGIPVSPSGLSAVVASNQVTVSWSTVTNASSYVIWRATAAAGPFVAVDDPEVLTFFIDAGLSYNTTYYYEVAAASLGGISSNSAPVAITTTPPPPAPITAIPGNAQVFVDWGDSAGATNYVLMRSMVNGGPYATIASTTNSSYLDAGLINGTTYYYVAYATGTNGASPLSVQAAATPSASPQMIKSDTTNMDTAADWSGVPPVSGQVGLFNNIISAPNEAALILGGDVAVGGLIFSNNLNGAVTVTAGNTLTLGSAGIDMSRANQSVMFNNDIALAATQVWNVTNTRTLTVNGTFTSSNNIVIKNGGGTLALGSTSNDSGAGIQVDSGTVQANAGSGILISLNGGNFTVNTFDGNPINVMSAGTEQNAGGNRTWAGNLTGGGSLTVTASSTHTWSGNNTNYSGTITVQGGGTLRLSSLTAVGPATAYIFNGGTMSANAGGLFMLGSLSGNGTLNTAGGENFSIGLLGGSTTYSGIIAGAGYVQKDGSGSLTLSGANTYSGGTLINSGVLQIGAGGAAGTPGSGNITNNGTLIFDRADMIDDTGFGTISGAGGLEMLGTGRLALTKAHTYAGTTVIGAGILALTNAGSIASTAGISISSDALFDVSGAPASSYLSGMAKTISGTGSIKGDFTVGANWTLAPGGNGIGTLTFSNSLSLAAGIQGCSNLFAISKVPFTNDSVKVLGVLANGGALVVTVAGSGTLAGGDSFRLFNAASYSGSFTSVTLPALSAGLAWNTNALNTNGTISVVTLAAPANLGMHSSGNNLIINGSDGTANWPYVVLTATNLAAAWTSIATNYTDGAGNVSLVLTNALSAGKLQSFYRLEVQ